MNCRMQNTVLFFIFKNPFIVMILSQGFMYHLGLYLSGCDVLFVIDVI